MTGILKHRPPPSPVCGACVCACASFSLTNTLVHPVPISRLGPRMWQSREGARASERRREVREREWENCTLTPWHPRSKHSRNDSLLHGPLALPLSPTEVMYYWFLNGDLHKRVCKWPWSNGIFCDFTLLCKATEQSNRFCNKLMYNTDYLTSGEVHRNTI